MLLSFYKGTAHADYFSSWCG